eukprot:PhF_6_TR23319/c0_g1_i4/m.32964
MLGNYFSRGAFVVFIIVVVLYRIVVYGKSPRHISSLPQDETDFTMVTTKKQQQQQFVVNKSVILTPMPAPTPAPLDAEFYRASTSATTAATSPSMPLYYDVREHILPKCSDLGVKLHAEQQLTFDDILVIQRDYSTVTDFMKMLASKVGKEKSGRWKFLMYYPIVPKKASVIVVNTEYVEGTETPKPAPKRVTARGIFHKYIITWSARCAIYAGETWSDPGAYHGRARDVLPEFQIRNKSKRMIERFQGALPPYFRPPFVLSWDLVEFVLMLWRRKNLVNEFVPKVHLSLGISTLLSGRDIHRILFDDPYLTITSTEFTSLEPMKSFMNVGSTFTNKYEGSIQKAFPRRTASSTSKTPKVLIYSPSNPKRRPARDILRCYRYSRPLEEREEIIQYFVIGSFDPKRGALSPAQLSALQEENDEHKDMIFAHFNVADFPKGLSGATYAVLVAMHHALEFHPGFYFFLRGADDIHLNFRRLYRDLVHPYVVNGTMTRPPRDVYLARVAGRTMATINLEGHVHEQVHTSRKQASKFGGLYAGGMGWLVSSDYVEYMITAQRYASIHLHFPEDFYFSRGYQVLASGLPTELLNQFVNVEVREFCSDPALYQMLKGAWIVHQPMRSMYYNVTLEDDDMHCAHEGAAAVPDPSKRHICASLLYQQPCSHWKTFKFSEEWNTTFGQVPQCLHRKRNLTSKLLIPYGKELLGFSRSSVLGRGDL